MLKGQPDATETFFLDDAELWQTELKLVWQHMYLNRIDTWLFSVTLHFLFHMNMNILF